jgi:hypothetical protein
MTVVQHPAIRCGRVQEACTVAVEKCDFPRSDLTPRSRRRPPAALQPVIDEPSSVAYCATAFCDN